MREATNPFQCRRCGACCRWPGDVWLTGEDIARLARALELDEQSFIDRFTRLASNRRLLSLAEGEGDDCILLTNNRCRVYEARPRQCRGYPDEWCTHEPCPGWSSAEQGTADDANHSQEQAVEPEQP